MAYQWRGDRDEYERLAGFARRYVLERYDYRAGAEKLESIYEAALNDPPIDARKRRELIFQNLVWGYGSQAYVAARLRLGKLLGR